MFRGRRPFANRAQEDPELSRALVTVFLTPPSLAVLEQRLRRRGTDRRGRDPEAA